MTLFLIAGFVLLLAGGTLHAQGRDSSTRETRELPAPPKVKSKGTAQAAAPARAAEKDSTAKPAVPRKSKLAAAAAPRREPKPPRVEKPPKPRA